MLGFAARLQVSGNATKITAISLPPPTTATYTKAGVAPATKCTNQFQHPALKFAGRSAKLNLELPVYS